MDHPREFVLKFKYRVRGSCSSGGSSGGGNIMSRFEVLFFSAKNVAESAPFSYCCCKMADYQSKCLMI